MASRLCPRCWGVLESPAGWARGGGRILRLQIRCPSCLFHFVPSARGGVRQTEAVRRDSGSRSSARAPKPHARGTEASLGSHSRGSPDVQSAVCPRVTSPMAEGVRKGRGSRSRDPSVQHRPPGTGHRGAEQGAGGWACPVREAAETSCGRSTGRRQRAGLPRGCVERRARESERVRQTFKPAPGGAAKPQGQREFPGHPTAFTDPSGVALGQRGWHGAGVWKGLSWRPRPRSPTPLLLGAGPPLPGGCVWGRRVLPAATAPSLAEPPPCAWRCAQGLRSPGCFSPGLLGRCPRGGHRGAHGSWPTAGCCQSPA